MRRVILLVLAVLVAVSVDLMAGGGDEHDGHGEAFSGVRTALAQATTYLFTFNGAPSAPQPWVPTTWDVQVDGEGLELMQAHHSAACGAPPATHPITLTEQAVFTCNDHIMTAMNSGYGAIYLTPNALVDFTGGEAVVRWDMSTFRTVGRDWIDVWVTPFEDNLVRPLEDWMPVYQGEPRRGVQLKMDGASGGGTIFRGSVARDFTLSSLGSADWRSYEMFFAPSAQRRDTFELRISRTRIKFGMPAYNLYWVDSAIADLGWSRGIVQFAHHAYNPTKGCDETHDGADPAGICANTWHWDNVSINPAAPFTILPGSPRLLTAATIQQVTFPGSAPSGSFLRFAGRGDNLEVSFNNGQTWQPAQRQAQEKNKVEHWSSFWTPAPAGATTVRFRGQANWAGPWKVQDPAIFATTYTNVTVPTPTPAPTTVPTPIPSTSGCTTRPQITLSSVKAGAGTLQITVTAGTTSSVPGNGIREVRFGAARNATIDAGGQTGRLGSFSVPLSSTPRQFTFMVRRASAGAATTVPLTVVDACGEWKTFVGGGPSAF